MQLTMWPLSAALCAVGILLPDAASAASLAVKGSSLEGFSIWSKSRHWVAAPAPAAQGAAAVDALSEESGDSATSAVTDVASDELISNAMQTTTACSCDCCQVQKLLPMDFVPQPNGQAITSGCWKAGGDANSEEETEAAICPATCQLSSDNKVLTTSKGEVDYNRFCNYNCQPVTDAVGTACIQFNSQYYQEAASNPSGNGKEVYPIPVLGLGSGFGSGPKGMATDDGGDGGGGPAPEAAAAGAAPAAKKKETPAEAAKAVAAAKAAKLQIVYDMRKLISERLRSEAGASVAAGAASAERVRINEWTTKNNEKNLKKLRIKTAQTVGKVEESVAGVESNKNAADEAEKETKVALATGRMFASKIAVESRKLADEAIKEAVAPCSALAAKNRAEAKGLDKPEDWVKVVAARAANPYQKAVTDAVSRTAEYKNLADSLIGQAYGAQKQANSLIPHVNVLEAQGDVIGATIEKKQVTNLLGRARSLQDQAKGYWKTASDTRNTIPKWQMAAAQAAAYAAWEYSNNAKAFR